MKLDYLTSSAYWFNATPPTESKIYIPLIIVFSIFLLSGLAITLFVKGDAKKIFGRYAKPMLISPVLVFICLFARYERLPWLASRFALTFSLALFFIWIMILIFWSARFVPNYIKEKEVTEKFNKYLPKAKKSQ